VSKGDRRCPHCSALLAGVQCKACNFVGAAADFPGDRCPKCGGVVRAGGAPEQELCRGCGKDLPDGEWVCPHCGYPHWGGVIGAGLVAVIILVGVAVGYLMVPDGFWRAVVGWVGGGLGLLLIWGVLVDVAKGCQAEMRYAKARGRMPFARAMAGAGLLLGFFGFLAAVISAAFLFDSQYAGKGDPAVKWLWFEVGSLVALLGLGLFIVGSLKAKPKQERPQRKR
jgi:hypothetical protein